MEGLESSNGKSSLDDFQGWDDFESGEDLFANETESGKDSTSVESVIEDITKDDEDIETGKKPKKAKADSDLFALSGEYDDPDVVTADLTGFEDEDEEEDKPKSENVLVLNHLKEKGFIDFELEEGEELTDELANELLEDKYEESIENGLKEMFDELPDVVKNLNKFALKGGNVEQLFSSLAAMSPKGLDSDLDLSTEANQILVMKQILKMEDNDDEEIDAQIGYLKDSGRLKNIAEKRFEKWKEGREAFIQQEADKQARIVAEHKASIREEKKSLGILLNEKAEIQGLTFSKEDKKVLPSYMNDRSVKLQNGNVITEMQRDLFTEVLKNKEASLQLAALLRNRNEDGTFNFDSIKEAAQTDLTKKVRDNVRRNKTSIPNSTQQGKRKPRQRSLAEYFN